MSVAATTASRERITRRRAHQLGLRMVRCGAIFTLYTPRSAPIGARVAQGPDHAAGQVVASAPLAVIEAYIGRQYVARRSGPRRSVPPPTWRPMIDDHLRTLNAAGQRPATIELRRGSLSKMSQGLGCPPQTVTAARLVDWFGRQTHWAVETRRQYRSSMRGFFSWAYKTGRVPDYLGDALPKMRQPKAAPRPAPDDAWHAARGGRGGARAVAGDFVGAPTIRFAGWRGW